MRLLFVADGRSPIATNWMRYFVEQGDEVHLASTFFCQPDLELASLAVVPVALSGMRGEGDRGEKDVGRKDRKLESRAVWGGSSVGFRTALRQWVGPLTLHSSAKQLKGVIKTIQPDLIHAMRIPFEGMTAALAMGHWKNSSLALIESVWGNDFTLHAPANPLMRYYTRRALKRVDAIHTDCYRDLRLAHRWGFPEGRPAAVLPGGGGVQPEIFYPPSQDEQRAREEKPIVINPRGFRAYVRNDAFFRAIPIVLDSHPHVRFVCPSMQDEAQAARWMDEYGILAAVTLLPKQTRIEMANLFRKALITVSPSEHDGTPNTLLEAMACGCFPIAGDIVSIREWIKSGVNGMLISPDDPHALAGAIINALESSDLRRQATENNLRLVAERATYLQVMGEARRFYERLNGSA